MEKIIDKTIYKKCEFFKIEYTDHPQISMAEMFNPSPESLFELFSKSFTIDKENKIGLDNTFGIIKTIELTKEYFFASYRETKNPDAGINIVDIDGKNSPNHFLEIFTFVYFDFNCNIMLIISQKGIADVSKIIYDILKENTNKKVAIFRYKIKNWKTYLKNTINSINGVELYFADADKAQRYIQPINGSRLSVLSALATKCSINFKYNKASKDTIIDSIDDVKDEFSKIKVTCLTEAQEQIIDIIKKDITYKATFSIDKTNYTNDKSAYKAICAEMQRIITQAKKDLI